jgi:hypothetical protein
MGGSLPSGIFNRLGAHVASVDCDVQSPRRRSSSQSYWRISTAGGQIKYSKWTAIGLL